MNDERQLHIRIERLRHMLRNVSDEPAREELLRLLAEARRELEQQRASAASEQSPDMTR
jgi:hypothetical protein